MIGNNSGEGVFIDYSSPLRETASSHLTKEQLDELFKNTVQRLEKL